MCGTLITRDSDRRDSIIHRGTESRSEYNREYGAFLVHHRLPIQTVEGDGWGQPIRIGDSYLLYNGEIFNYPDKYESDVEYLKDLFSSEGISGALREANKWDGFWAIVYLNSDGDAYCFTDPLGKKQLYYNNKGEICSEIKPLLNQGDTFDEIYKSSVRKWGYNTGDRTPFSNIKRMVPNRLYSFNKRKLVSIGTKDYYDWTLDVPYKDSLKWLMIQAVKRRLLSKTYKIGALVSGGLDSAIIAKILNDLNAEVQLYSIENNESEYAAILGEFLGKDIKYMQYAIEDDAEAIFKSNETPIDLGSVIPQHKLMQAIPETIILTGDGADELFGGYKRTKVYDSQKSDVFEELPYYHLPRLDRASMRFTKELRSPFLSHDVVKFALNLPYRMRQDKNYLREVYAKDLPEEILKRDKLPLKNFNLLRDTQQYTEWVHDIYYNKINWI